MFAIITTQWRIVSPAGPFAHYHIKKKEEVIAADPIISTWDDYLREIKLAHRTSSDDQQLSGDWVDNIPLQIQRIAELLTKGERNALNRTPSIHPLATISEVLNRGK